MGRNLVYFRDEYEARVFINANQLRRKQYGLQKNHPMFGRKKWSFG